MARVSLALEDVGLAMPLQEALESAGHIVTWSPPLAKGPQAIEDGWADDVVVVNEAATDNIRALIDAWRDREPPPAVLAVITSPEGEVAANQAHAVMVPASSPTEAIAAAVPRAMALRYAGRLSAGFARGALGLPSGAQDSQILAAARGVDARMIKEALGWYAAHYCSVSDERVAALREQRALQIPEVELTKKIDGASCLQTLVKAGPLDGPASARFLWALASIGVMRFSPEPPDLSTLRRRAVAMTRQHVRARHARMNTTTYYDLLEVSPEATPQEIDHACRMLGVRFLPKRLAELDLSDVTPMVEPLWQHILQARATLSDPTERLKYNAMLHDHPHDCPWAKGPYDLQRAEQSFARAQQHLVNGDAFKAGLGHGDSVPDAPPTTRISKPAWPGRAIEPSWPGATIATRRRPASAGSRKRHFWADGRGHELWWRWRFCAQPPKTPRLPAGICKKALTCDPNLPAAKRLLGRLGRS